ncbi:hypothetical protein, partial [Acinetobacter baumannii]|uniref:hypothetical protein n=1 Tax=Acinetobacter baumannii TaxID=470 RepID=UPI00289CE423
YDNQRNLIINFFNGIKYYYDKENIWNSKAKNPFVKAAGFAGAVDFLTEKLLSQCVERKSFRGGGIKSIISLEKSTLITWD